METVPTLPPAAMLSITFRYQFSTPALGMPNWLFYLPAAIGMLLFGMVALRRLLRALKGAPVAAEPVAVVTEGAAS